MPTNSAAWRAPSRESLAHENIRLDCDAATIRNLWRATDRNAVISVLAAHFARCTPPGMQDHIDKAEAFFESTQFDNGRRLYLGEHKRAMINNLGGFHGVEELGVHSRSNKLVRYCSAGDPYAPTLCFMGRRMFVACWGDLIEKRTVRPVEG